MLESFVGTDFCTWIKVTADPHAKARGFSILGLEFRALGYGPIEDAMQGIDKAVMVTKVWAILEAEVFRVEPRLKRYGATGKPWYFPIEFCQPFVRPKYAGGVEPPKGFHL